MGVQTHHYTHRGAVLGLCVILALQIIVLSDQPLPRIVGIPDPCSGIFASLFDFDNLLELGIADLSSGKHIPRRPIEYLTRPP